MAWLLSNLFGRQKQPKTVQLPRAAKIGLREASPDQPTREAETAGASAPRVEPLTSRSSRPQERDLSLLSSDAARDIEACGPREAGKTIDGLYAVKEMCGHSGIGVVYRVPHVKWKLGLAVNCVRENRIAERARSPAKVIYWRGADSSVWLRGSGTRSPF